MSDKPFCTYCGEKRTSIWDGRFDGDTGKATHILTCVNKRCPVGRERGCDHEYRLFGHTCKKCGWIDPYYYP